MTGLPPPSPAVDTAPPRPWRPRAGTLVALATSGAMLALLYRSLDVRLVAATLARADPAWLVFSVALILPITFLRAVRFYWVAPPGSLPGVGEAMRLTLVSSALNVFVPAKAGDLAKSYFVATRSHTSAGVSIAIVVYERLCDLAGLLTWCVIGWAVGRTRTAVVPAPTWVLLGAVGAACITLALSERAADLVRTVGARVLPSRLPRRVRDLVEGWPDLLRALGPRRSRIVGFSLVLWLTHLVQIWLFAVTLSAPIPFTVCASLSALALMAGQLPFTVAGLGARDLALVALLSPYVVPETAAAMGILTATRNLLPPLAGAPLMGPYLSSAMGHARSLRRAAETVE